MVINQSTLVQICTLLFIFLETLILFWKDFIIIFFAALDGPKIYNNTFLRPVFTYLHFCIVSNCVYNIHT